jgi:LysR family transcriptional regulator, regulator for metE and metH
MFQSKASRLEIRHLAVLHEVARWGTASAAAEHLGLTPSAITHRIREAERRLGIRLTLRVGSSMRLTEAGLRLVGAAEKVFDELNRAEIDAARIGRGIGPVVRFGMGTYSFYNWLPDFKLHFETFHPGTKLEIVGEATHRPLDYLRDERVDILLLPGQVVERDVIAIPCFTDELVCVMSPGHGLASRTHVEAMDLVDETHITYSSEILLGFEYDSFFRPGGYYPKTLMNIALPEAAIELVTAGLGISILSRWILTPRLRHRDLVAARLAEAGLPLPWNVVIRGKEQPGGEVDRIATRLAHWLAEDSRRTQPTRAAGDGAVAVLRAL